MAQTLDEVRDNAKIARWGSIRFWIQQNCDLGNDLVNNVISGNEGFAVLIKLVVGGQSNLFITQLRQEYNDFISFSDDVDAAIDIAAVVTLWGDFINGLPNEDDLKNSLGPDAIVP